MATGSAAYKENRGQGERAFELYERKSATVAALLSEEADYHPVTPLKTLTPAEIRAICLVILVVTAVAMGIIFLAAEAAVTQNDINTLKRDIAQVDDDIANLKIDIEQSQNMQLIKIRAMEELGMQEPSFEQYVYVNGLPDPGADFGRYIRERAYGAERSQAAEPEPEEGE